MSRGSSSLDMAREVADAVLYEGYLLYPYRASSSKNQTRFQFGVLGPPGAAEAGLGEASAMTMQCLLTGARPDTSVVVHLRFLQVQHRQVYDGQGRPVDELATDGRRELTWDEAVEHERSVNVPLGALDHRATSMLHVPGAENSEQVGSEDAVPSGTIVRRTWPLDVEVSTSLTRHGVYSMLEVQVRNTTDEPAADKAAVQRRSLVGAHLLVEALGCSFVSVMDPPADAAELAAACHQDRCWPFLAGPSGSADLLLGSPIILYDHPEIAAESAGALFDSTEIDEILTLRVMTMTDAEKAEARATDPRAREIIDRCDAMSATDLQQLHGIFRDPHGSEEPPTFGDTPWWDPAADESVRPEQDSVVVNGVPVSKGSLVRVRPSRRADAQDLFFADQVARVTAVLSDVDGGTHVALVLVDDPAADLHEWYGRYFYFAPEEIEPLDPTHREESRP